ncbi:MAG: hypothetical protein ACOX9A_10865 [Anaerolineae bacterium]|jgi:hypothetical protein
MHIYCTYCSREKDSAPGNLPAVQRYRSARIATVAERARDAGVSLCILSGKYGLIPADHPIPWYDHLLQPEEVPALVETVTAQMAAAGITAVTWFERTSQDDGEIRPYRQTMEQACRVAGVRLASRQVMAPSDTD